MIRKVTIVVLTLGAVGATVGGIVGNPSRLHLWDVGEQQRVGFQHSIRFLNLMYFRPGDPASPGVFHSFGGCWFRRDHMYREPTKVYSSTLYAVGCPSWLPVVVFAIYPTIAFIRGPLRRHRRRRKGLCKKCGYDLTGNESGVCPECGMEHGNG